MTFKLTNKQALELAWSKPMRDLAALVGVSDVALSKSFRNSGIPVPPRGYWNKLAAGKPVPRPALPLQDLGTPEVVWLSGDLERAAGLVTGEPGWDPDPIDLELLSDRFRARVAAAKVPPLKTMHPELQRYVAREDARRARWASSPILSPVLGRPMLEEPREQRRIRMINAILLAATKYGQGGYLRAQEKLVEGHVQFGGFGTEFTVTYENGDRDLVVGVRGGVHARSISWRDRENARVEDQFVEILVGLARQGVEARRRIDRDVALAKQRQAKEEVEAKLAADAAAIEARKGEQRRKARRRVQRLLRAAKNLNRANVIRELVAAVGDEALARGEGGLAWIDWASAQADILDPTKNGELEASIQDAAADGALAGGVGN